jgi:hypothetical protein
MDWGWTQSLPWAGQPFVFEYSYNGNPYQQMIWNGNTLQSVASGQYAYNAGNALGVGPAAAAFKITQSGGSAYTIQEIATGLYVSSPGKQAPPNFITFSPTATMWFAIKH